MTDTTDQQAVNEHDWLVEWLPRDGYGYTHSADEMRAAIRHRLASVSSASAEGFVLVPRMPTPDIVDAACSVSKYLGPSGAVAVWSAMLAASPEPVPATNQAGEVERISKADALAVVDRCTPAAAGGAFSHTNSMRCIADDIRKGIAALATQPATSQEAIEAGKAVLEGRGDGTYAEAEQAIRALIAHIEKPATSQEGEVEKPIDNYEKAYFERGMFAAYAWMETKKRGEQLSDAVVDRAWDNRDAGMGPTECLPRRPLAATLEDARQFSRLIERSATVAMLRADSATIRQNANSYAEESPTDARALHEVASTLLFKAHQIERGDHNPSGPMTARQLTDVISAWLDDDDATHWGAFEKALHSALAQVKAS